MRVGSDLVGMVGMAGQRLEDRWIYVRMDKGWDDEMSNELLKLRSTYLLICSLACALSAAWL